MEDATLKYLVCYADTDAGGIVYHGRFLEMVERARNRVMYGAGLSFGQLADEYGIMLIVHRAEAVYYAPAGLEDHLELKSRLTACQASRSIWVTDVRRDNMLLARVTIEMVALDIKSRQLARHPDAVIQKLTPYVETAGNGPRVSRACRQHPVR